MASSAAWTSNSDKHCARGTKKRKYFTQPGPEADGIHALGDPPLPAFRTVAKGRHQQPAEVLLDGVVPPVPELLLAETGVKRADWAKPEEQQLDPDGRPALFQGVSFLQLTSRP